MKWSVVAGVLLGLATLTRSTALGFLPLAAVWLAVSPSGASSRRDRLLSAAALCLAFGAVLAPWTVRNYAAYGRFVAVDTTSGYNLWLGSVGVRDEARLRADLDPLPGPVARQDFAFARAVENMRADPLSFARKGLKESVDLCRPLFSAEERQVSGYTLGRVPAWHLTALLALDDLLYLLIVLAAIAGLLFCPPTPLKTLSLLWVLLWMLMAFVFFAVTRFRLPIVAVLIPWSARGLLLGRGDWSDLAARARSVRSLAAGALAVVALVLILPSIAIGPTGLGIERWYAQEPFRRAEALLERGSAATALSEYLRADTALADTRYGLASAYIQRGDTGAALGQLTSREPSDRFEPFIIRGEVARRAGDLDAARRQFTARAVNLAGEEALRWAWAHTRPAPVQSVDVGTGLDVGYVRGFESVETDSAGRLYRWSTEGAEIRGLESSASGAGVTITLSAWRPEGAERPRVTLATAGGSPTGVTSMRAEASGFGDYDVELAEPAHEGGAVGFRLFVDPYVPGGSDPRVLGVRVSTITVKK
jgi:hypothetical protein